MNKSIINFLVALFVFIILAYMYSLVFGSDSQPTPVPYSKEGFSPLLPQNSNSPGTILQDYPVINPTGLLGEKNSSDLWQTRPTSKVGSYDQTTNNVKYFDNPDIGNCSPITLCNTLYGNKSSSTGSGSGSSSGVRVGLHTTDTPTFF